MFFKKLAASTGVLCGLMSLCAPVLANPATAAAPAPQTSSAEQVHPSYNLYGGYFELGALPFGLAAYGRFGYVLGQPSSSCLLDTGLNLSIGPWATAASLSVSPRYIFGSWTLGPEVNGGYCHINGEGCGAFYGSAGLRSTYQLHHRDCRDSAVTFGVYVLTFGHGLAPFISVGYIF